MRQQRSHNKSNYNYSDEDALGECVRQCRTHADISGGEERKGGGHP